MIGKTIGNYRIVEKLGKGATGTVFKAVDDTLGREVAVKLLHADVAQTDVMKRFQMEVKALAKLNHPEIATIHDVQITDDGVLLVTELVRGEDLDALMKRVGPLQPERAAVLVTQILSALSHAHEVGVVHRDLKPTNVIVTELGTLKLLDFAMAPVEGASQMTAAAFAIGTPAYMAPERILGNEVDERADIYAVGAIMYRLLTGKVPFEADSPTAMVQKQLTELPVPVTTHRPELPEWCEDVLARALAKSPVDRFKSANEFRAALLDAIAGRSGESTDVFTVFAPVAPAGDAPTLAMPSPVAAAPSPSRPMPAIDPDATFMTAIPAGMLSGGPQVRPAPPVAAEVAPTLLTATSVPPANVAPAPNAAVLPVAAAPPQMWGGTPTMVGVRLDDFTAGVEPTLLMSQPSAPQPADEPTMLVPAASAPTVAAPMEALAPTAVAPAPVSPTGTTLVMKRKQFAAAGVILGVLAVAAVVLAVVVLRRSGAVAPPPEAITAESTPAPPPVSAVNALPAPAVAAPVAAAPPPPLEIVEPAIRTPAPDVPAAAGARGARPARPATPEPAPAPTAAAVAPANPNLARITDTTPFKFEARAVVVDGDKRRERDAGILIADGTVTVSQADGAVLYSLPVSTLTGLTYSNSRQPLWNSPNGPAEAMRVESGAFGFLKGGRNWLGFRTPEALMVLRVDDSIVGRVIAGLQERTGLTVARLIEPKE